MIKDKPLVMADTRIQQFHLFKINSDCPENDIQT